MKATALSDVETAGAVNFTAVADANSTAEAEEASTAVAADSMAGEAVKDPKRGREEWLAANRCQPFLLSQNNLLAPRGRLRSCFLQFFQCRERTGSDQRAIGRLRSGTDGVDQ